MKGINLHQLSKHLGDVNDASYLVYVHTDSQGNKSLRALDMSRMDDRYLDSVLKTSMLNQPLGVPQLDANGNIATAGVLPRTGTSAELQNLVLPAGVRVLDTDTGESKISDGVTGLGSTPAFNPPSGGMTRVASGVIYGNYGEDQDISDSDGSSPYTTNTGLINSTDPVFVLEQDMDIDAGGQYTAKFGLDLTSVASQTPEADSFELRLYVSTDLTSYNHVNLRHLPAYDRTVRLMDAISGGNDVTGYWAGSTGADHGFMMFGNSSWTISRPLSADHSTTMRGLTVGVGYDTVTVPGGPYGSSHVDGVHVWSGAEIASSYQRSSTGFTGSYPYTYATGVDSWGDILYPRYTPYISLPVIPRFTHLSYELYRY